MSFRNAVPDQSQAGEIGKVIQWHRGDLRSDDKLLRDGCWQLPVDRFPELEEQLDSVPVTHSDGKIVRSFLFHSLDIAVLAFQKHWFLRRDGVTEWGYQPGARSRWRFMAYVRELVHLGLSEPVVISVSGLNAKETEAAFKQFKNDVVGEAQRVTRKRWPVYGFWLGLESGGKQDTRHGTYVTPPAWTLTEKVDDDTLDLLYVGDELLAQCAEAWPEAQAWSKVEPGGDREPEQAMTPLAPYVTAPAMETAEEPF